MINASNESNAKNQNLIYNIESWSNKVTSLVSRDIGGRI